MPLIKPRAYRVKTVRHICRLQEPNRDVLVAYARFIGEPSAGHTRESPTVAPEDMEHYRRERNHQGLDNQLLQRAPPPVRSDADVQRRERLGGLLSFYYREAA